MRPPSRAQRLVSYGVLGGAFLVVALYAGFQTIRLRAEEQDQAVEEARSELSASLRLWEANVLDRASTWLLDAQEAPDPGQRERRHRVSSPYFDAIYRWELGSSSHQLTWPPPAVVEAPDSAPNSLAGRLRASTEAAEQLLAEGRPQAAWSALVLPDLQLYAPLSEAHTRGLPVQRLLLRRLLAADALEREGDRRRQRALLWRTAAELAQLPGPEIEAASPWISLPLLADLARVGSETPGADLGPAFARARRAAAGYREVSSRLQALSAQALAADLPDGDDPDAPLSADAILQATDREGAGGFLLLYAAARGGRLVAAVQLSQDGLIDELLAAFPKGVREPVILDADGRLLRASPTCAHAGALAPEIWASVPFGRLLSHLRLGLCAPAGQAAQADAQKLAAQLAPVALALLLGGIALAGRLAADRRLGELYERQQAFIARVTHELKTPLAGIRIMAETLEIGAFRDADQRAEFAGRILSEVDRLGARIDEVLRVAKDDAPPDRAALRLDVLAAEVLQPWPERFAVKGARLETDLRPCPEIIADRELVRDALNNLLDNALKYLREDRPGQVVVSTHSDGKGVVFDVADNGLGVPSAQRKSIFEPFVRVEGPGRGLAGGHGLGLSFVAETARLHAGTVECRDGIDGGARFVLRLRGKRWKKAGSRASSS